MKKRQQYSLEFKRAAVRLVKESGRPVTAISRELGVNRKQLYSWTKALEEKADPDVAFPGPGARPLAELSEVERLRRDLKRAQEENEILKKAAAYFARELS